MQDGGAGLRGGGLALGCALLYFLASRLGEQLLALTMAGSALGPAGRERLFWGGMGLISALAALPPLAAAWPEIGSLAGLGLRRPAGGVALPAALWLCLGPALGGLTGLLPGGQAAPASLPLDGLARGFAFLQLCVLSALAEELVFRGAIQGLLAPLGKGWSVLGQAAVFACLHGSPARMAYALGMGLALGWTARRCRSLWPGAALHVINNAVVFGRLLAGG